MEHMINMVSGILIGLRFLAVLLILMNPIQIILLNHKR